MMKMTFVLVAILALAGCRGKPEQTQQVNSNFAVETLFTKDSCTVYRFYDGGYRYFTNCSGTASWTEGCGKNCTKDVETPGGRK